jgi:hypothetical protein
MERRAGRKDATPLDIRARDAAIAQYHETYETFAESAQHYAGTDLEKTVMDTATMFLLAADAERTDPPTSEGLDCACTRCQMYRMGFR